MSREEDNYCLTAKFNDEFKLFCSVLSRNRGFACSKEHLTPRLNDATTDTSFNKDYIYHSAWAARRVAAVSPDFHTDFSSNLYLAAILSAFVPVKFYDYRLPALNLPNLEIGFIDLTKLPFADNSIPCVSCLSVVEHVGLGRYGDPIDPDGDLKSIQEIQRVVKEGGSILLNVPIAETPLICFNAHRIYSIEQILNLFEGYKLEDFLFIHRGSRYSKNTSDPTPDELAAYNNGKYASGCFHFIK